MRLSALRIDDGTNMLGCLLLQRMVLQDGDVLRIEAEVGSLLSVEIADSNHFGL
jgi:hypothetical protein